MDGITYKCFSFQLSSNVFFNLTDPDSSLSFVAYNALYKDGGIIKKNLNKSAKHKFRQSFIRCEFHSDQRTQYMKEKTNKNAVQCNLKKIFCILFQRPLGPILSQIRP